jgi:hypothetical protein
MNVCVWLLYYSMNENDTLWLNDLGHCQSWAVTFQLCSQWWCLWKVWFIYLIVPWLKIRPGSGDRRRCWGSPVAPGWLVRNGWIDHTQTGHASKNRLTFAAKKQINKWASTVMASDTYFEKAKTLMKKQKSIETVPSHQRWEGVQFTQRHPTPIIIFFWRDVPCTFC